jgi:hypothetical protein
VVENMTQEKFDKAVEEDIEKREFAWKPLQTFLPKISPRGQQIEDRKLYFSARKIADSKLVRN